MKILEIETTQHNLKRCYQIPKLVDLITEGMTEIEPIQIHTHSNGCKTVANGHHRLAAYYLAGRVELEPWEYEEHFAGWIKPTSNTIDKLLERL